MTVRSALSLVHRRLTTSPGAVAAAAAAAAAAAKSSIHVGFLPCSRLPAHSHPRYRMLSTTTAAAGAATSLPRLPILEAVAAHDPASTAVIHALSGRRFTYGELLGDVARARERLREAVGGKEKSLTGERVAFLIENSYDYVVMLLAIMAARAIAVPLSPPFPAPELQYILDQSAASVLVASPKFAAKAREVLATDLQRKPVYFELPKHTGRAANKETVSLADEDLSGAGLMLYTSGTTNRPKGVLLPEEVLTAQCRSLHQAWEYSPADRLLHVLPLHHIHGTVNAVLTPLFAGSSIEFMFPFNADAVWKRLAAPFLPNPTASPITFFTVVPTVYSRLLASHKALSPDVQAATREATSPRHLRVNISGSAALPTPVKAAWAALSGGNVLLERYGMTEVGMALSCGLAFSDRVDASVGWPLPSVEARLVDMDTGDVIEPGRELDAQGRERSGEIQLRGPTIFREYWRNPDATAKEFVDGGEGGGGKWFKTGDVAVRRPVDTAGHNSAQQGWAQGPMYFIQGRMTADIIKTGGEKVSALEVERELLSLPEVAEAAVVAVPSGSWGQKVGAVIILDTEHAARWTPLEMRRALKGRLAAYKIPQVMKIVDHIPRNAMGKINKKQLVKAIFVEETSGDEL
ncbi:2-succinylbenzoate-CoA ligase [Akanthomyces lecanii RCEF 1005]|uniref:2-succinylbenzoate-CoA ligase n=1 Tax=Akanthomyces lecanii RCEF 1005 TaxID=1081108 RepID=A0A168JYM7_CORDF|nr:2-succinylbenzoate-CoA ligase [Akanthomyces lecanii RCEF 1005]